MLCHLIVRKVPAARSLVTLAAAALCASFVPVEPATALAATATRPAKKPRPAARPKKPAATRRTSAAAPRKSALGLTRLPRGAPLYHAVVGPGAKSPARWLPFFLDAAVSEDSLQRAWPVTSMLGHIWTRQGRIYNGAENVHLRIALAPGYAFYQKERPSHVKAWRAWEKSARNRQKPNRFSPAHVEVLKTYGYPWHSAFYDQHKIVGTRYPIKDSWNLVNFAGVASMTLIVPDTVRRGLPRSLRDRLPPGDEIEILAPDR